MMIKQRYWLVLPAMVFVFILLAGMFFSIATLKELTKADWEKLAEPSKILSGESTHLFIRLLNQNFVLGSEFSHIEHGIQWNLTGDLGAKVRAGCDDWLFYSEELEVHSARADAAAFRSNLAAQIKHSLNAQGINLLLVVVPDKTRIEAEHLCGLNRSELFKPRITNFIKLLSNEKIEAEDLTVNLAALPGERYYRTDTHWNEKGSNSAAMAIADKLSVLHWTDGTPNKILLSKQLVERPGDLIHLAGLDNLPSYLRPKNEWAPKTAVAPIEVKSNDLFGDAGLPTITLIGSSYSRNSNFSGFLEQHLGLAVANLAKDGGDFAGAAKEYFGSATFHDNPPKLVIWEIPERVIEMPIKPDERALLALFSK
jgi:alginate O-acetyltransferase complex protein AlgJ